MNETRADRLEKLFAEWKQQRKKKLSLCVSTVLSVRRITRAPTQASLYRERTQ